MILLFLLLNGSMPQAGIADRLANSIYAVESENAPVSINRILFFPSSKQFSFYYDPGAGRPSGGLVRTTYDVKIVDGLVVTSFARMSVPLNIGSMSEWRYDDATCTATTTKIANFPVICSKKGKERVPETVFEYSPKTGITGFYAKCFLGKDCWFELKTKMGILAQAL